MVDSSLYPRFSTQPIIASRQTPPTKKARGFAVPQSTAQPPARTLPRPIFAHETTKQPQGSSRSQQSDRSSHGVGAHRAAVGSLAQRADRNGRPRGPALRGEGHRGAGAVMDCGLSVTADCDLSVTAGNSSRPAAPAPREAPPSRAGCRRIRASESESESANPNASK